MHPIKRNRILYSLLTLVTILLGLASRRFFDEFPFVRAYVGDGLWALMVFFGFALVFNRWSVRLVALVAFLFSFGIELSQLYHAPWIDNFRSTRLVAWCWASVSCGAICYVTALVLPLAPCWTRGYVQFVTILSHKFQF